MNQKIKKAAVGILAAVLVLSGGTTSALAACPGHGRYYVDANGDGVCDYAKSACSHVDQNQDGICDTCGKSCVSKKGRGRSFVDANGDGICDNYGKGHGNGHCGGRKK